MTTTSHATRLTISIDTPSKAQRTRAIRELIRGIDTVGSVLEIERWASSLLGRVWERRHRVPPNCGVDPMLVLGAPILESLVEIGGREGRTALTGVAQIDRGALGRLAKDLAGALADVPIPDWLELVGTAGIVNAFSTGKPGDGEALMLEVGQLGDMPHMVAVFIAEYCGGIAKHLSLTRLIDPTDPTTAPPEALDFRPIDHVLACRRVEMAIARSDDADAADLGPGFADHRALAISRIRPACM